MAGVSQVIELTAGLAGQSIHAERKSATGTAIVAGMLVEETGGELKEHSTAAGSARAIFALPNLCVGGTIDTVYGAGEDVRYGAFSAGQKVNALVAASATAIANGDPLESAGDGTLRKVTTAAATASTSRGSIVAYAAVALDNSGGSEMARIAVNVA